MRIYSVLLTIILFEFEKCSIILHSSKQICEIGLFDGNYEEFESVLEKFHTCMIPSNKFKLTLYNYVLPALPNDSFSHFGHMKLFRFGIEGNSKLQLLLPGLPGDRLFHNSQFDSVIFDINDLSTLTGWRWKALADLEVSSNHEGFEFIAVRSKLVYLHSDFGKVAKSNVKVVRILKCQLRWLGKNVFAPLYHLKTLELRDNLIERIGRSHLPLQAPELRTLDLGNNKLQILPQDFVDGLNLESILLGGNNIKITDVQAYTILTTNKFPLLLGVLWPCICNVSSNFSEIFGKYYEEQYCYGDGANIFNFKEVCSH